MYPAKHDDAHDDQIMTGVLAPVEAAGLEERDTIGSFWLAGRVG